MKDEYDYVDNGQINPFSDLKPSFEHNANVPPIEEYIEEPQIPNEETPEEQYGDSNEKTSKKIREFYTPMVNAVKEFFKFEQFKRMHPALAVFIGILLSPFLLMAIGCMVSFYVALFMIKVCFSPVDFMADFLRNESDKTAVQVVVYLVGFPAIFSMKMFMAFASVSFWVLYFLFINFAYVYGCGGIKYQPFLFDAKDDCSAHLSKEPIKQVTQIVVGVIVGILCLGIILGCSIPAMVYASNRNSNYSGSGSRNGGIAEGSTYRNANSRYSADYVSTNTRYTIMFESYESPGNNTFWFYFSPSESGYYYLSSSDESGYLSGGLYIYVYEGNSSYPTYSRSVSNDLYRYSMYFSGGTRYCISFSLGTTSSSGESVSFYIER